MNLIYEKTEDLLNSFINQIKDKAQSWRLITIEFQDCETLHSSLFQNLCLKNLHASFDETECRIFWKRPGFILIFFQGRAMPIEKCVEGFLKETEFKGFGRFFDILDLSIHWDNLISLVNRISGIKASDYRHEQQSENDTQTTDIDFAPQKTEGDESSFQIQLSKEKIDHMAHMRASRFKPLLLLVEDDPFTLQLIKLAFKDTYDVITAETARQALVYYQRHLPDMVFLDIQLPDGNGINLLDNFKKADSSAYIMMLSSHSEKEKIIECQSLGAKGFIAKPFTRQRLIDAAEKFRITRKTA